MTVVHERVTHLRVVVLVAPLVGGRRPVPVVLLAADESPAAAVGDVAELFHVDVDQ